MSNWGRYWRLRAEPFEGEFLDFPAEGVGDGRWQTIVMAARQLGDHDDPPSAPLLDIEHDPPAGDPVSIFRCCLVRCSAHAVSSYDLISDMNPHSDDITGVLTELRRRGAADVEALIRFLVAMGWDGGPANPLPLPWWVIGAYESDHWVGLVPPKEVLALWQGLTDRGIDALLRARRPAVREVVDLLRDAALHSNWLLAIESCG